MHDLKPKGDRRNPKGSRVAALLAFARTGPGGMLEEVGRATLTETGFWSIVLPWAGAGKMLLAERTIARMRTALRKEGYTTRLLWEKGEKNR